jgi:hypothetical protein
LPRANNGSLLGGGIANLGTLSVRGSTFSANTPSNIDGGWTDLGGNTFS